MDRIKKLVICLAFVLCAGVFFPTVSDAVGNQIRFSDPETQAGKDVSVEVHLMTPGESLTGGEIQLVYNPAMLEFKNGEAENAGNGILKIKVTPGTVNQEDFNITFKALKSGESDILVNSYYVSTNTGNVLTFVCGSSHITTAEASEPEEKEENTEETEQKEEKPQTLEGGDKITVDGQEYTIVDDFVDQVIPEGFKRSTTVVDGKEHGAVKQTDGEATLVYLMREGDGNFYYYSAADNSFSVVKSVEFLPGKYLLLTNNVKGVKLPKSYKKVTFKCGETKMPGWQNDEMPGFTIVRAIDKSGLPALYRMDSQDGTFQRFVLTKKKDNNKLGGSLGKMMATIEKNIEKVITGIWIFLIVVILTIVILACKLKNRNAEILDLYEEFGVFENRGSGKKKKPRKNEKKAKQSEKKMRSDRENAVERSDDREENLFAQEDEVLFNDEPFFDAIDVESVMPGQFDDYENLDDDFGISGEDSLKAAQDSKKDDFNIEIMRID